MKLRSISRVGIKAKLTDSLCRRSLSSFMCFIFSITCIITQKHYDHGVNMSPSINCLSDECGLAVDYTLFTKHGVAVMVISCNQ